MGKDDPLRVGEAMESGVAAGRCDYADQFRTDRVPSDVTTALRDFVFDAARSRQHRRARRPRGDGQMLHARRIFACVRP